MTDIKHILEELKSEILSLASENLREFGENVLEEAEEGFSNSKSRLRIYMDLFRKSAIDSGELEELVRGEESLWQMKGISKKAEAKIALDKFREGVFNLTVNSLKRLI